VGPEEYRFDVHKALLCESSNFFQAALNGNFKEREGKVRLPDQETRTFKFFVHWLYTGKLRGYHYPKTIKPTLEELKDEVFEELANMDLNTVQSLSLDNAKGRAFNLANYRDAPFSDLIALYALADTLQVHDVKDQIVTLLVEVYAYIDHDRDFQSEEGDEEEEPDLDEAENDTALDAVNDTALDTKNDTALDAEKKEEKNEEFDDDGVEHMDEDTPLFWSLDRPAEIEDPVKGINMAWETLPARSPLCKLLVRCFCDCVVDVAARTQTQEYHPGFIAAVAHEYALRWAKGQSPMDTTDWDIEGEICKFHEHDQEDKCAFSTRVRLEA
jgi:hypothetical protein